MKKASIKFEQIGGLIIVVLLLMSGTIMWEFSKDYTTLKRDGEIVARSKWYVEAERTWKIINYKYQINSCFKKGGDVRNYTSSKSRCYYPDDYYERLSRSLINTKLDIIVFTLFPFNLIVNKVTPYYKYGTRGSYAGKLNETFLFINTTNEAEFPEKYFIDYNPTDTRNYKLIWKLWDVKEQPLVNGNYTNCKYTTKNLLINLKEDCDKLDYVEVKGKEMYFYFTEQRSIQELNILFVDPKEKPPKDVLINETPSYNDSHEWQYDNDTWIVLPKECYEDDDCPQVYPYKCINNTCVLQKGGGGGQVTPKPKPKPEKSINITLPDGSKIEKSVDNLSLKFFDKKDLLVFNITSSTPYNFIGDFKKTKEWGYFGVSGWNYEIYNSKSNLILRKNRSYNFICIDDCIHIHIGKKTCKCVSIPKQLMKNGTQINNFTFIANNIIKHEFYDELDPAYQDVNITDYYTWYNFSDYTDESSNSVDLTQGSASSIESDVRCIGGKCVKVNESGSTYGAHNQHMLASSSGLGNVTIGIQVTPLNVSYAAGKYYFKDNNMMWLELTNANAVKCGTYIPNPQEWEDAIITGVTATINTSYVFFCKLNASHICGRLNTSAWNCETIGGVTGKQWGYLGGTTKTPAFLSSGLVVWERVLNESEIQEAFNCLSTRGDINEGCEVSDSTAPTYSLNSTNSTLAGEDIGHSEYWQDDEGLSGFFFSFCNGTWNGSHCESSASETIKISLSVADTDILEDARCNEFSSGTNYGSADELRVNNASGGEEISIIKIKNNITSGSTIANATLRLCIQENLLDNNAEGFSIGVHYDGNQTWSESVITWDVLSGMDNFNSTFSNSINFTNSTTGCVIWNITNIISQGIDDENITIRLISHSQYGNPSATDDIVFNSKEFATPSLRPEVNITFITPGGGEGWVNDSFVEMKGTGNWSNVTKKINSTVGLGYAWQVFANDTSDNWNSSLVYTYTSTSVANNTPTFNESLTAQTWTNNTAYEYNVNCSDSDGDTVYYFDNTSYFNITYLNGTIYYTPNGAYNETINITCGDGNSNISETFDLEVVGTSTGLGPSDDVDYSVVLNLTFDSQSEPYQDYSSYNHTFQINGNVNWSNRSICKWYGCANFSVIDGSDYLNSSTKFNLDNGMTMSFWVYSSDTSSSNGIYQIGSGSALKWSEDSTYGMNTHWEAFNDTAGTNVGSSNKISEDTWTHFIIMYNESQFKVWIDGDNVKNVSNDYGNLNYTLGELIFIGRGLYSTDITGYLDEFLVWNRSDFTLSEIDSIYDGQRLGTPPDLDIYVKTIKYALPYNWSHHNNSIIRGGTMDINITIANAGTTDSTNFNYNLTVNNVKVCSDVISITAGNETNITCIWTTQYGFQIGNLTIDTYNSQGEDYETNNYQKIYIPFLDRPFIHFNLTEWATILKPYCDDSSNGAAYSSCNFFKVFSSEDFNPSWTGDSVDPRGKKGRESAMGCLYNHYPDSTQCTKARNHLFGWGNRTISSYSNVQAIHELSHVGMIYDIMFPNLTQTENDLVAEEYYDICQHITNLDNVRPDKDTEGQIKGGNGWGFGSGMAGFCYSIIGAYKENPTLIQDLDTQYWGKNIPDEWMDREIAFLRAYKNDSWSKYQEGWLYKFYSQFHLVENFYFQKKHGLSDVDDYNNAFCAMGRELITDLLDHSYDGKLLRNDESRNFRGVQRGDSNSYEDVGSGSIIAWSIADFYGILCDDTDTKSSLVHLRDISYNISENTRSIPEMYIYKQLRDEAEPVNPESLFPKSIIDNANDIFTIRTNYTYVNDTVIQVDGGEERGSGHSQAQGYYLYALGEPFIDFEQVPYEDDVRMDIWKNGISLLNQSQTTEGTGGVWNSVLGQKGYNQFYGNDGTAYYSTDYPDYRTMSLNYSGDLEDYIGTKDANFAGVFVWRPYFNLSEPVEEYFIKYNDVLIKRTKVTGNTNNQIYHNFLNIEKEFGFSNSGVNITFNRTRADGVSVFMDVNTIWSNQTLTLGGGGNSSLNTCYAKTSCSGSYRGNSSYRRTYLYSPTENIDFILAHHWYKQGSQANQTPIGDNDKGLNQSDNIALFDTNNNGAVNYTDINATGWGLVYNQVENETGAFNTTHIKEGSIDLFSSNDSMSVFIERSSEKIIITANTMKRKTAIDYSVDINVTIDAQEMINTSGFTVKKNGATSVSSTESGTKVTFTINTEQNSDYYVITAGNITPDVTAPVITISNPTNNTNLSTGTKFTWINITTDESANCSYGFNDTGYINMTAFTNTDNTIHSFNYSNSTIGLENGNGYTLFYKCQDASSNNNTIPSIHVFYIDTTSDSCTWSGSGDWRITHNCVLDTYTDITPNNIYLECPDYVNVEADIVVGDSFQLGTCQLAELGGYSIQET